MTLAVGTRLGPYDIQSALGAGGMGEVYRARDTRLDRTVAIKILPESLAADPQFRERFNREARAISQLTHPHICVLHDIGHQDGTDFLVLEYLEGETLADRLKKGALPLDQALSLAIQIADALATSHRAGITHRDLNFDRIARELCTRLGFITFGTPPPTIHPALVDAWNARGAADIATLEAELPGVYTKTLDRALRRLDR